MSSKPISETRNCDFCFSEEGQLRMIGDYTVILVEVEVEEQKKLACQSCRIKNNKIRKSMGLRPSYKKVELNEKKKKLLNFGFR